MSHKLFLAALCACLSTVEGEFVIDRGERDVFRNLTACSGDTPDFCYNLHAEQSAHDPCVCRCLINYPMYRNPDVYPDGGKFISKGRPGCVWHANHRYECFHIRKLGRGFHTNDDEQALEFDLSKPGSVKAFSDHDLSTCTGLELAIKMPEQTDFAAVSGLLNVSFRPLNVILFEWSSSVRQYNGGLLRGVFTGCNAQVEAERCFVGKVNGVYNGGECKMRATNGECCIFPLKYNGTVYNNCTSEDGEEPWCAVRLPFVGNEEIWRQNCFDPTENTMSPPRNSPSSTISSSRILDSTPPIVETRVPPILGPDPWPVPSRLPALMGSKTVSVNNTQNMSELHQSSAFSIVSTSLMVATVSVNLNVSSMTKTLDKLSSDYLLSTNGSAPSWSPTPNSSIMVNRSRIIDYESSSVIEAVNGSSVNQSIRWQKPKVEATKSKTDRLAIIIVIVMGSVAFLAVTLLCCLFFCLKQLKNRNKKYEVIAKKPETIASQSPVSQCMDIESVSQTDAVSIEEEKVAETEFIAPPNEKEEPVRPSGRYNGPSFITFSM